MLLSKALLLAGLLALASAHNLRTAKKALVGSCSEGAEISPEDSPVEGTITDNPVQSDEYANKHKCSWKIAAGPAGAAQSLDSTITLTFDRMDLEKRGSATGKCYDSVEVFNGCSAQDDNSNRIGDFCGDTIPPPIVLNTKVRNVRCLYVRFRTDGSGKGTGFRAKYSIKRNDGSAAGGSSNAGGSGGLPAGFNATDVIAEMKEMEGKVKAQASEIATLKEQDRLLTDQVSKPQ